MDRKTIIAVAPNGARKQKADHPQVPMTIPELARTAATCAEAGAAMIHLHVRGNDGGHVLDAGLYREATVAIRREAGPDMIVQITTEAVGIYSPAEQIACVRGTEPEAVSIGMREIFAQEADERESADFLAWLHRRGTMIQHILYTAEDVERFVGLCKRGLVPDGPHNVLYVLGRYTPGQQSGANDLRPFLAVQDGLPEGFISGWFMCAFGRDEAACAVAAAAMGGHVRVGFENNMLMADGALAADNAALVAQTRKALAAIGRDAADGATARGMLAG